MKKARRPVFLIFAALIFAVSGCEWEGSGDSGSWDDSMSWVNLSGTYRPSNSKAFLVSSYSSATSTPASLDTWSDYVGTGNAFDTHFSTTLSHIPVVIGSVSVSDGTETFLDPDGDGLLTGSSGGTGSINYDTGAIDVAFILSPSSGVSILATYQYYVEGTTENPEPGTSDGGIYSLTVIQQGNLLSFTDSNGATYTGYLGSVSIPGGSLTTNLIAEAGFMVIATYEVSGVSASGQTVTITGTFELTYAQANTITEESVTPNSPMNEFIVKRSIEGTWVEANGTTGDVQGYADDLNVELIDTALDVSSGTPTSTTTTE